MSQQLKTLYIMCGPAGGGKSTWVRNHAAPGTSAHISRDRIRFTMVKEDEYYFSREEEVYDEFIVQIVQALECSWVDTVYADATHLTKNARQKLIKEIDSSFPAEDYDIVPVVIKPILEQCLAQNENRTGRERVPNTVIRRMYNSYEDPAFDDIHYVRFIYEEAEKNE